MTSRRNFLSAVGATAATVAAPRIAGAQARGSKLALYANVGPVLTRYEVDIENATLTARDSVTTPGGTVTRVAAYTYLAAPTVTTVTPSSGPVAGNTLILITGSGFTALGSGTTVTVGGVAVESTATAVRFVVVSTSSIGVSHVASGSTPMGDQLCAMPRARMRQPLACAQLASVTTSCGEPAVAVQMESIAISPDQLR